MPVNSKSESGSAVNAADPFPDSALGVVDEQGFAALQKANADLVRVSRYRSLFLARLSHELRTPLTSILGFAEILLNQEKLTDAQRSFCERIQSSAHQLQNSLNQLSDLARLEAGQTKLAHEKFSLAELVRESLSAVARRAQKKHVTITCDVDEAWPTMTSDRGRVRQVLYNVLAYAITRSPEGETVIGRVELTDNTVEVIISDRGEPLANPGEIGMLEEANDKSGTGELGLAIARQNIQLLSGALSAVNSDTGLEVIIRLPLSPPA